MSRERNQETLEDRTQSLRAGVRRMRQAPLGYQRLSGVDEEQGELRHSEERLRFALESIGAGMWDYRPEIGEVVYDSRLLAVLGHESEGLPADADKWFELLHTDDVPAIVSDLQRLLSGDQGPYDCVFRMQAEDGRWRWLRSQGKVFARDAQGNVTRAVGIITEVTESQRAQRLLRLTQESIEKTDEAVYWIDEQCRFHYVNSAACRILGYTREELLMMTVTDLDPGLTPGAWNKAWQDAKSSGFRVIEENHRRKDGTYVPVETNMHYVPFEGEEYIFAICRDVTDRRSADENLRREKDRAQLYLDIAGVVLVAIGTDGRITMINRKGHELLGYREGELLGKNWFDLCIPEPERETVRALFGRLMAGSIEPTEYYENAVLTSEGKCRLVAWHNTVVRDDAGQIVGSLSSGEDVTERKRATEELALSAQRFRSLVEQTSESIFCYEYDPPIPIELSVGEQIRLLYGGVLVECNDVAARSYGAARTEDVIGKKLTDLRGVAPGSLDGLFRRFIEGGYRVIDSEDEETRPDGAKRYFLNNARGVVENGMLLRVWGTYREITDRKRSEEELRESEHRFRAVVEQAADAFLLVAMDNSIIDVNQQTCEYLGYTREELLGMSLGEIDARSADRMRDGEILRELEEGKYVTIQSAGRHKSGRVFPVEVRVGMLRLANRSYLVGLARDVTERQRLQETIIQSEKMMTVGGLAAGMAHEINNPLSGILQGVQNVLRRISPELQANRKVAAECGIDLQAMNKYLERRDVLGFLIGIQAAGNRAARIVKNMLQFSRPGVTEHIPTDLGDLLDRTLDLAAADFDLKKRYDFRYILVERQFDRRLRAVPCIATELEQVFLNILKNAAEAMSEQEARTEPRRILVRTLRENGLARIEIEDNGPGMDEPTRRRVFEPFFTTKETGSGTGLGLSVSYFIITNNHRGTIDVESQPGKGAKFIIRLPL